MAICDGDFVTTGYKPVEPVETRHEASRSYSMTIGKDQNGMLILFVMMRLASTLKIEMSNVKLDEERFRGIDFKYKISGSSRGIRQFDEKLTEFMNDL